MSLKQRRAARKQAAQQRKDDLYWQNFTKENEELKTLQAGYYEACGIQPVTVDRYAQWLSRYLNIGCVRDIRFVPAINWNQFGIVTQTPSFSLPPLLEERARYLIVPGGITINAVQKEPYGGRGYAIYENWGKSTVLGHKDDDGIYLDGARDVVCSPEVIAQLDLTPEAWDRLELHLQTNWKEQIEQYHERLSGPPYEVPRGEEKNSAAITASITAWRQHADDMPVFIQELDAVIRQCRDAIQAMKP